MSSPEQPNGNDKVEVGFETLRRDAFLIDTGIKNLFTRYKAATESKVQKNFSDYKVLIDYVVGAWLFHPDVLAKLASEYDSANKEEDKSSQRSNFRALCTAMQTYRDLLKENRGSEPEKKQKSAELVVKFINGWKEFYPDAMQCINNMNKKIQEQPI